MAVQFGPASATAIATDPPADAPRLSILVPGTSQGTWFEATSSDGAHVFIRTSATLVPGPTNPYQKLYDVIARRFLSLATHVYYEASTSDGSFVLFQTSESLAPGDDDEWNDLYLRGPTGDQFVSIGTEAAQMQGVFLADDGSTVVFSTGEGLLPADTDVKADLYRWSSATETLTLVTPDVPVVPTLAGASADGSRLFVSAYEDFLGLGRTDNLYESTPDGLVPFGDGSIRRVSADGSRVFFETQSGFVPGDQDDDWDGYEWSASGYRLLSSPTDDLTSLVDVQDSGATWVLQAPGSLAAADTDGAWDVYVGTALGPQLVSRGSSDAFFHLANPAMTSIIYVTASSLVPEDTDEQQDLYRWDAANPDSPQLVTRGDRLGMTEVVAINNAGDVVIIETNERIADEDTDLSSDVYRWTPAGWTLLSPDSGSTVKFRGASSDVQRVFMETTSKMDPVADTNGSNDVYVSDLDVTPPVPTIQGPPDSDDPDATIVVGAEEDDAVWFDCQLDGGSWEPCATTVVYTDLAAGPHTAAVHGYDAAANRSVEPATAMWTVLGAGGPQDTTAPTGAISIASGAAFATSMSVLVSVAATDAGSGLGQVALSNDGATWIERPYAATQSWSLPAGTGVRTVWARWRDVAGNWSSPAADTIVLDANRPVVGSVAAAATPGSSIGAEGSIPLRLTWTATDVGTGIARYEIGQSTDSGPWVSVVSNLTVLQLARTLMPGHIYAFRVRAIDVAGNAGAWRSAGPFRARLATEVATGATYTGPWSSVSSPGFTGGTARRTSSAKATVTYSFTGSAVAWVAAKGAAYGSVKIYVDGTYATTVDLHRTTTLVRQVAFSRSWATRGPHTVTLVNVATKGHPYANVDGFVSFDGLPTGSVGARR